MSEEMKYCTQCGSENNANSKFCSNCGAKMEIAESVQPETVDNVYAQGLPEETTTTYETVKEAEEIKPEPIQEEIKINYDNDSQGGFSSAYNNYDDNSRYSTFDTATTSTQYYSSVPTAETVSGGNIGVAIASVVCGILSLLCCCLTWFSFLLAAAAIALGIITIVKKYDGKGMAIAGIVTGGIGLLIFIISLGISVAMPYEELFDEILNEMY